MFDFVPVVSDRMVLASMSDPNTYLGGDDWLLVRPFRKDTWCMIAIIILVLISTIKLFSLRLDCIRENGFKFSESARNIAYLTVSFFFMLVLAYYEGALIMFFSSNTSSVFDDIKGVMSLYPDRKLMVREGYDVYYLEKVESGDKDYVEFWNRVKNNPEETVFTNVEDVFQRFSEGGVVIHELEGTIKAYLHRCGGERTKYFDAYVRGRVEHHNLIVTKNSPLGPILNYGSRVLLERGSLTDFKSTLRKNYTECKSLHQRKPQSMSMQFRHFWYLFISLMFSFLVCVFILIGELGWKIIIRFFPGLAQKPNKSEASKLFLLNRECTRKRHILNPAFYSLYAFGAFNRRDYHKKNIRNEKRNEGKKLSKPQDY